MFAVVEIVLIEGLPHYVQTLGLHSETVNSNL